MIKKPSRLARAHIVLTNIFADAGNGRSVRNNGHYGSDYYTCYMDNGAYVFDDIVPNSLLLKG